MEQSAYKPRKKQSEVGADSKGKPGMESEKNRWAKVRAKRELAKSVLKVLKKGGEVEKKWITVGDKKIQIE